MRPCRLLFSPKARESCCTGRYLVYDRRIPPEPLHDYRVVLSADSFPYDAFPYEMHARPPVARRTCSVWADVRIGQGPPFGRELFHKLQREVNGGSPSDCPLDRMIDRPWESAAGRRSIRSARDDHELYELRGGRLSTRMRLSESLKTLAIRL